MSQSDVRLRACAQWMFSFIKLQLTCGFSLSDIERRMLQAVESGELKKFVKDFVEFERVEKLARNIDARK